MLSLYLFRLQRGTAAARTSLFSSTKNWASSAAAAAATQQVGRPSVSEEKQRKPRDLSVVMQALSDRPWDSLMEVYLRDSLLPSLNPAVVATIIQTVANYKVALKFFIWAGELIGFPVLSSPSSIQIRKLWRHQPHMDKFLEILYWSYGRSRCCLALSQINILIQGYGWAGMIDRAMDLMCRFDGFSNVKLVNSLLRALYMDSRFDTVVLVYRKMVNRGCTPDSFTFATMTSVIRLLCKGDRIDAAKSLLQEMLSTKVVLEVKALNNVLKILCEAKEIGAAENVFRDMLSYGSKPDATSYNILLHGFCNNGYLEKARSLFEELIASGSVCLDSCTYVTLINGLCDMGKVDDAMGVMQKWRDNGSSGTVYTYGTFLKCLCASGKLTEAYQLLDQMDAEGCHPNIVVYGMLIDAYCKVQQTQLAHEIWNRMIKMVVPDLHCCRTIMSALCLEGRMLDAKQVFTDMLHLGCAPDVYCCCKLIDGYLSVHELQEAKELVSEVVRKCSSNNTTVLTHLSHAVAKSSNIILINTLFEEMNRTTVALDLHFWNGTADGFLRSGNLECAIQLISQMHHEGISSSMAMYEVFITRSCQTYRLKEASKLLDAMVNNGCKPDLNVWNTLIDTFCKAGQIHYAFNFFSKMRLCGCSPDTVTYRAIISGLLKIGNVAEAKAFMDDMKKDGFDPDAGHCAVIKALSGESNFEGTIEMASDGHIPDVKRSTELLKGLCRKNRVDDAIRLLEEMCIKGSSPDEEMYSTILTALFRAGREEDAMIQVEKMAARGCKFTDITRSIVCNNLLMAGRAEMASRFLHSIEHP